ncbi:hypothetical protein MPSEU_000522900 [Mayamaea pseudoterrestris]|nr:hypothetical protein MPSEU_000522900 [Mayamaea pseudoterrestris]
MTSPCSDKITAQTRREMQSLPSQSAQTTTRLSRGRPWTIMPRFFATTLLASVSVTSAFTSSCPLKQRYHGTNFEHRLARQPALAEIDSVTRTIGGIDRRDRRKQSEQVFLQTALSMEKPSRIQFRGLTTTKKNSIAPSDFTIHKMAKQTKTKTKEIKMPTSVVQRKYSTMPAFMAETAGQRAFKAGIRSYERRSGRVYSESLQETMQRSNDNASKFYAKCANAPESLVHFSREIQKHVLLTHEEELALGALIQDAIRLQRLYDLLEIKFGREPTDQEWCAAAGKDAIGQLYQALEHGRQAKNRLVVSNLRLVQKVVNIYIRNGLTPQYNAADMMQEGIMALIRAAEKYEPDRGWKFSTYGMYWIRSAVKESHILQSRLIPLPQKLRMNCERLDRLKKKFRVELGRWPTQLELSKALGLSEHQIDRCYKALQIEFDSLDQPSVNVKPGQKAMTSMADDIDSRVDNGDYAQIDRTLFQEDIIEAMKRHLAPQEVEMLLLRYGLRGQSARTGGVASLKEISNMFGVSVQKVSVTITRSLRKLRGMGYDEWLPFF